MSDDTIGALRHRLTLEQSVPTPDGGGGNTKSWVTVAEVWGALEPLSGIERVEAARLTGRHMYEVRVRYRADVELAMRFTLGARILNILSVEDVGARGRWLRILCEEHDL